MTSSQDYNITAHFLEQARHSLAEHHLPRVIRCLVDLGFSLNYSSLRDTDDLFLGLEEFRQHLGGRLTLTMLRAVGDPVDVHEIDPTLMRAAIRRLKDFGPLNGRASPRKVGAPHYPNRA